MENFVLGASSFDTAPSYLADDWPKEALFMFPLDVQYEIPAKEMIFSLDRVKKEHRYSAEKQAEIDAREKENDQGDSKARHRLRGRIVDRKIQPKRAEALQVKAYGSANVSRMQAHQDAVLRSCEKVVLEARPPRSRATMEFMRDLERKETNAKTIFELLTESQHSKHGHVRRIGSVVTATTITSGHGHGHGHEPLSVHAETSAGGDSDTDESADAYTEANVLRRLSVMPLNKNMRHAIFQRRHSSIQIESMHKKIEHEFAEKMLSSLCAFTFVHKLKSKFIKLRCERNWSQLSYGIRALTLLQAKVRGFLAHKRFIKQQLAKTMIKAFLRIGMLKLMRKKRRNAIDLVAQFIRDHSKRKQLSKIVRGYMRKVRVCQRVIRSFLSCRTARLAQLVKYANVRLGLHFDKYSNMRASMQNQFNERLLQYIRSCRRDLCRRRNLTRNMLMRGEGAFHAVRLEDVRQFLKQDSGGGGVALPPQVSSVSEGLSWTLYSNPKLPELMQKYHQAAMDSARALAEQAHRIQHNNSITVNSPFFQMFGNGKKAAGDSLSPVPAVPVPPAGGPATASSPPPFARGRRGSTFVGAAVPGSPLFVASEQQQEQPTQQQPQPHVAGGSGRNSRVGSALLTATEAFQAVGLQKVSINSRGGSSPPTVQFSLQPTTSATSTTILASNRPQSPPRTPAVNSSVSPLKIPVESLPASILSPDTHAIIASNTNALANTTSPRRPSRPNSSHFRRFSSTHRVNLNNVSQRPFSAGTKHSRRPQSGNGKALSINEFLSIVPTEVLSAMQDVETFMISERQEQRNFQEYYRKEQFLAKGKAKKII